MYRLVTQVKDNCISTNTIVDRMAAHATDNYWPAKIRTHLRIAPTHQAQLERAQWSIQLLPPLSFRLVPSLTVRHSDFKLPKSWIAQMVLVEAALLFGCRTKWSRTIWSRTIWSRTKWHRTIWSRVETRTKVPSPLEAHKAFWCRLSQCFSSPTLVGN